MINRLLRRDIEADTIFSRLTPFIIILSNLLILFGWVLDFNDVVNVFNESGVTTRPLTSLLFIVLGYGIYARNVFIFYGIYVTVFLTWTLCIINPIILTLTPSVMTNIIFVLVCDSILRSDVWKLRLKFIWFTIIFSVLLNLVDANFILFTIPGWVSGISIMTTIFFCLSIIWIQGITFIKMYPVSNVFNYKTFPLIVVEFDMKTYTFKTVSNSVEDILGYTAEEMQGTSFTDYVSEEDAALSTEFVDVNLGNEFAPDKTIINTYKCKDGSLLRIRWFVDETISNATNISFGQPLKDI